MKRRSNDVQQVSATQTVAKKRPAVAFDPIAAALQQIHCEMTAEAIPDDFMALLDKFDELEDDS